MEALTLFFLWLLSKYNYREKWDQKKEKTLAVVYTKYMYYPVGVFRNRPQIGQ